MNDQNIYKKENIENNCATRTTRKRPASNSSATEPCSKLAKINSPSSSSSSSPLRSSDEMGISMLDSEDSSDMMKMHNAFYGDDQQQILQDTNINDKSNHIYHNDEPATHNYIIDAELQKKTDNSKLLQQKVVTTVTVDIKDDVQIAHKCPKEKSIRSPLATVEYNVVLQNMHSQKVQAHLQGQARSPQSLLTLPSTSQQAKLLYQQQKVKLQKSRKHQCQCLIPSDDFFLFRNETTVKNNVGKDRFSKLSDEIILQIFKWLPKDVLLRCSVVCHRFNRCASDESLWARLDLANINLRSGALESIFKRGVTILRMAQAEFVHPVFEERFLNDEPDFESKVQYLDLSMVTISKPSLKMLLSRCRQLKKLSLEHVPLNDDICTEISKNINMETLNLAMCSGIEAWSVRKMLTALQQLSSLNISWTNLSVDAVTSVVTTLTPNILRLNVAGCRKTMFDSHLTSLAKRCPQLLELDLSDCTALTGNAIIIICSFKELEYLSLSRCYAIGASSYIELQNMPTLAYLDIFGMLTETALSVLRDTFKNISINQFIHSSVARPTVGTRRTSIWGLRTRDL